MTARVRVVALLALGSWGCVYYNGLWSAHRYARDARRQVRAGQPEGAISNWSVAAVQAESVAARHPHSRWLPDALVTAGEGMAGAGDCGTATPFLDSAVKVTRDVALLERVALARAECALAAGNLEAAEALGRSALASKDGDRRDEAALVAGRAARRAGAPARAATVLAKSAERAAGVEEVLSLIEAGQSARADTLCDALIKRKPLETDWDSLFVTFARAEGPAAASRVVGRLAPRLKITAGARARLLLTDGRRLLAAGDPRAADRRFSEAAGAAPDSLEADQAQVARFAARVAQFTDLDSLSAVTAELVPYVAHGGGAAEARRLQQVLTQIAGHDSSVAAAFRSGELARDSLDADPLAAALLLGFARHDPRSLFAPKAILAALPLSPESADSLTGVLDRQYSASPYTLAMHGALSPGYVAAEDSLARLFGIRTVTAAAGPRAVALWTEPVTGRRGPLLDPPEPTVPKTVRPTSAPGRRGVSVDTLK